MTAAIAVMLVCGGRGSAWAGTGNGEPPRAATSALPNAATQRSPATTTAPSTGSLAESYADREASAPELQNFQAGDVVIVGTTGLIIVLLLVIILLSL